MQLVCRMLVVSIPTKKSFYYNKFNLSIGLLSTLLYHVAYGDMLSQNGEPHHARAGLNTVPLNFSAAKSTCFGLAKTLLLHALPTLRPLSSSLLFLFTQLFTARDIIQLVESQLSVLCFLFDLFTHCFFSCQNLLRSVM